MPVAEGRRNVPLVTCVTKGIARSAATSLLLTTLVDRQRPVAGPSGALRASKFAPGEFVVAALLAMTSHFLNEAASPASSQ